MRLSCSNPVRVRNQLIGGPKFLVCLPLVTKNIEELSSQAKKLVNYSPDLIEWRVDAFNKATDWSSCLSALKKLRSICNEIPLIFTFRHQAEGGMQNVVEDIRLSTIEAALASGMIDLVDIEIRSGESSIGRIKKAANLKNVTTILSHHDFNQTPPENEIIDKLRHAQYLGADIAKVALMPRDQGDVLTLLNATYKARAEQVTIPQCTISMGEMGAVSRVFGGQFGSDITFASHETSSAPGQISVRDLQQCLSLFS